LDVAADRLQVVLPVVKHKHLLRFGVVRHRTGVVGASLREARPRPEATSSSYEQVVIVSLLFRTGHSLAANGVLNRHVALHAAERRGYRNNASTEDESKSALILSIILGPPLADQIIN
jgi:hypothetical protein